MNPTSCPTCQRPIPPTAPGGLCPACVLRDAEEPAASGRSAPTVAEVASAFPQWEVQELIGRGGMGSVFKVRQPALDRVVALKILCPELGRDPAFAERFAREARVLAKLKHPNIVTVFEHGEAGGYFYLLMEFVDGVNLRQAMRAGRFTPDQALAVVPGICDALHAAHAQGVWHRDIKPENILLDADGAVKIVDFGIARLVGDPARDFTLTCSGAALGSAPYMAPEQHEKPHEVDHRADIYSLGVVIYEMLTGELPLGRFPAPSRRAAVSARIDEIVLQTLEKERELRQQSADEVKTDVRRVMRNDGEPVAGTAKAGEMPRLVGWSVLLWIGGLVMAGVGFIVLGQFNNSAAAAGAVLLGTGAAMSVSGLIGSYRALYEMKRALLPPVGRNLLIGLVIVPMLVAVFYAMIAACTGFNHSGPNGLVFQYAAIALAGTYFSGSMILLLARPLAAGGGLQRRLRLLGWIAAACLILAGSWMAKHYESQWPSTHHWQSGLIRFTDWKGRPSDQEILSLARKAAGPYADSYQLVMEDGTLFIRAISSFPPRSLHDQGSTHVRALASRLWPLLPNSGGTHLALHLDFGMPSLYRGEASRSRFMNATLMTLGTLMACAGMLSAVVGGRRISWLVLSGLGLLGLLAVLPAWPQHDTGPPRLIAGPPPPPFSPEELPSESDFSNPEAAVRSIVDAARRGQVEIIRRGLSKAMLVEIERNQEWEELTGKRGGGVTYSGQKARLDKAWDRMRVGDAYLIEEDGQWKLDSLNYVTDARNITGPFTPRSTVQQPQSMGLRPPRQRAVPLPSMPHTGYPLGKLIRLMNQAANESDWDKLCSYKPPFVGGDRHQMALLAGEIVRVRHFNQTVDDYSPAVVVELKRYDGTTDYVMVRTSGSAPNLGWGSIQQSPYGAACRVEFKPTRGDADKILRTHLEEGAFPIVVGKSGQFDILGIHDQPVAAKELANRAAEGLPALLKPFGMDTAYKIIQPATVPSSRWRGVEEPAVDLADGTGAPSGESPTTEIPQTPDTAMRQLLEAAHNHNGRVFTNGLSRSMIEAMKKEGSDPAKNFGDFDRVAFVEAKKVDEKTAEVVVEAKDGTKRRVTMQMVLEDGAWKLTEHGL